MAEEPKGLQHLIDNPQDLDVTDTKQMESVMKELAALDGPGNKEPEPAAAVPAAKPTEPAKAAEQEPATTEGAAVLAPDGKSTIPYAVLKAEREARAAAEGAGRELAGQVNSLMERIKALETGQPQTTEQVKSSDEIEAEIAALEEEAPAVADAMRKIIDATNARNKELVEKLASLEERNKQSDEEYAETVKEAVQKAIDSTPALVHWKANDPELWAEAQTFDNVLRERPEWADKSFEKRFEHVVKLVVANHDESVLPEALRTPPPSAKPKSGPTPEEVTRAAEAKLNASKPKAVTLTDMPAGAAPEQSEQEKAENMSVQDLHTKFATMTPQQMQDYMRSTFST